MGHKRNVSIYPPPYNLQSNDLATWKQGTPGYNQSNMYLNVMTYLLNLYELNSNTNIELSTSYSNERICLLCNSDVFHHVFVIQMFVRQM